MEDVKRRYVFTDDNELCQKPLSLRENVSKGSPGTSDTKPFTASKRVVTTRHFKREGERSFT